MDEAQEYGMETMYDERVGKAKRRNKLEIRKQNSMFEARHMLSNVWYQSMYCLVILFDFKI